MLWPLLLPWNDVGVALNFDMLFWIRERKTYVLMVGFVEFSKNYPCSLNVVPYTNYELEQLISSFGTDRMLSDIKGSSSIQLFSDSLIFKDFNCLWNLSKIPLNCGWNDVVFILSILASSLHISKFVVSLLIIDTPNFEII